MAKRNVGILLFPNAELLDLAGPYEVFSVASELNNYELFDVFAVAKSIEPIQTINGLSINPKFRTNPETACCSPEATARRSQILVDYIRQTYYAVPLGTEYSVPNGTESLFCNLVLPISCPCLAGQ